MVHIEFTLNYFQIYFITINIFSFFLFAYDKFRALHISKNVSRISEKKLLLSSLIGGSIGSVLAMLFFRHKIKKFSFLIKFLLLFIFQIVIVLLFLKGLPF